MSRIAVVFALLVTGLPAVAAADTAAEVVTVATFAPDQSPWGQELRAWQQEVAAKTGGKLAIELLLGGAAGDEDATVAKVGSGEIGGALLSRRGLVTVHRPIAALTMPWLFRKPASLTAALPAVLPDFKAGARKDGFVIAGLGAAGVVRMLSQGRAIEQPADLKTMKVYRWAPDAIAPVEQSVLAYTGVPSSVPGLLPAISSGRINVLTATSIEATQLQWSSQMDHVHAQPIAVDLTGMVFSKSRINSLPTELRRVLLTTAARTIARLSERLSQDDAKAFAMIKNRMTLVELSAESRAKWRVAYKQVRAQLRGAVFEEALVDKLESLARP